MDCYQIIARNFQCTVEAIMASVDELAGPLEQVSAAMIQALLDDGKVLTCGIGADGALAQLLSCNLLAQFEHDRPALPAVSLASDCGSVTAIAAGNGLEKVFSRQVQALGQDGDVLFCISSTARAHGSVIAALEAAHERNMTVVVLSNAGCQDLTARLGAGDLAIPINAARQPLVLELQTMAINCLCELIDQGLFGGYNQD